MFGDHYIERENGETIFSVDPRPIKFGIGACQELAYELKRLGMSHVAIFTDAITVELAPCSLALQSLDEAGIRYQVYSNTRVEPTDRSFADATQFLGSNDFDGLVSIGGGSVIDTAKAANLLHKYPADLLDYVNKPIGKGKPVPGKLMPHIACPTTSGTGSESTGVAVFDLVDQHVKTGISSALMKPDMGIIDPSFTWALPPLVTAATGFDVLTHAIESYTAVPFTKRKKKSDPALRPPYQGANPHSDSGSLEAVRLASQYLLRSVNSPHDKEARSAMMYAATLAGISFGNAGVHVPHGMSYSVAGMIRDYYPEGWPQDHSMCPHGISVVVNAPAAFRFTGQAMPERHWQAAQALGADMTGVTPDRGGDAVAQRLVDLMRACGIPNGLSALNYTEADIPGLVDGAYKQQRLLVNSPREVTKADLADLYRDAMSYW
ncbi:MAG: iron-containing alcohol dehydrogenase [Proteobacteria bacterium]|nr:iron-containing alcohol dehydrogenase [Pseudomonadota bacterium]